MFHKLTNSLFLGVLASAVLVFTAPIYAKDGVAEIKMLEKPEPAPIIMYKDADRKDQTFTPDPKKLTILHFWATWCVPCVKELTELEAVAGANGETIDIMPLSLDGKNTEKVKHFFESRKFTHLRIATDEDMSMFRVVQGKSLPTSLFIRDGKVFARADGTVEWGDKKTVEMLAKK